jgi:N-acetylglucosaminyldiphosphoundecaprenol N-acetyl-beta-D-mannosaminyltransferase
MQNEVFVLQIHMFNKSIHEAANYALALLNDNRPPMSLCISATGAHGLVHSRRNQAFARVLRNFFMNLPDGMPSVWIGRLKGAYKMKRCYGPSFFELMMRQTAQRDIGHFLCGGKERVATELQRVCMSTFKNPNVVGCYCPPFREMTDHEMKELAEQIHKSGAQIVWIGLSTPKQEYFAARLATFIQVHFIITVGAAFDFHTGRVRQAPRWIQKSGLEWFFRLLMEPRRLWKRYCTVVPLFLWYNFLELMLYIFSRFFQRRPKHA